MWASGYSSDILASTSLLRELIPVLVFSSHIHGMECSRQWQRKVEEPEVLPKCPRTKPVILGVGELENESVSS